MDDLDSRLGFEAMAKPIEEVKKIPIGEGKKLQIGTGLSVVKDRLTKFLKEILDIFAWSDADMVGIDPKVACHSLNVDPKYPPKRQKRRLMNSE